MKISELLITVKEEKYEYHFVAQEEEELENHPSRYKLS